jgi:NAD(P)-dependent dehydrogenase (short-subunit alcohol dehydrogenase family)
MADPLFTVEGHTIIVAGGAGGLGRPLAEGLVQRGARVLVADIDERAACETAAALCAQGGTADAIALDVVSSTSCASAVAHAAAKWGRLDGLVNASGVYSVAPALELEERDWERTIDINVTGAFRLAREAGRIMVAQGSGRIVTLASVSSAVANPRYVAYAASKAAAAHLTRVLAVEWAPHGVTVNAIGPAAIPTPLSQPIFADESQREAALARIPMGRFGTPEDIVGATVFLLSPAGAFVTGQTLFVDGGRTVS